MQALTGCCPEDTPTPAYTCALANMTRMHAAEYAPLGIEVNASRLAISRPRWLRLD
jgi:hypothetical protein